MRISTIPPITSACQLIFLPMMMPAPRPHMLRAVEQNPITAVV